MSGAVHSERFYFPFKHFQNEAGALEVGPSFESVCLWESEAECQQTQVRRFYTQMIFMCWMLMLNSRKTGSVTKKKKKVEDSRFLKHHHKVAAVYHKVWPNLMFVLFSI